DGAGVTIGVISNSFDTKPSDVNGANYDVLNFELPGVGIPSDGDDPIPNPYNNTDVNVLKEYPYGQASDEGRAMMQIVHDVAPGANLYFRTGVLGAADMAAGIHELAAYCDIIVDDVTYITEPFFENGVVADAVNSVVTDQNVKYFTSAGNFGGRSYTAEFNESTHSFEDFQGYLHDFNPEPGQEDVYQHISASVPDNANLPIYYTIVLQWDDGVSSFEATQTDLDIYLVNDAGLKLIGCNKDNRGGKAIEVLPFAITKDLNANIVIAKTFGNSADVTFKYIVFKGLLENVELNSDDNSTIIGHANTAGAMTVGAIRYDKTPAYENDLPMEIMSFSSVGSPWTGEINKPDFTAPNGVNTTVDLGNGDWDGDEDELPNFFGTSAAAPHAAAVAALLLDAYKSYYYIENEPFVELTTNEVRSKLSETAITEEGYDEPYVYGNGFIQADRALMLLGNPAPVLYELDWPDKSTVPGRDYVNIIITGDYFTEETVLYFNGPEVAIYEFVDENTLTATIPPFTDLYPPITAENPPRTYLGKDGGMSNAIYFTDKPIILGTYAGATKKYGQDMPGGASLTYSVYAMGEEPQELEAVINSTTFPDEDIPDIPGILSEIYDTELLNNADALANAGIYPYYIHPSDWLNPQCVECNDPDDMNVYEEFLLEHFSFRFDLGDLKIIKLDMTVAVDDPEVDPNYGDPIDISVTFEYNTEGISAENNAIIQTELQDAYEGDVLTDFIALVDEFTYALDATGTPIPNSYFISEDAYNAMVSAQQALAMVNGKALAMVNHANEDILNGMAIAMVNRTQALAMVNGKALAMVNLETLLNGQALAMVNTNPDVEPGEGEINGLALAMVNKQALAMVNAEWTDAAWDEYVENHQALAMVNKEALVNGKALAMVNQGGGLVNGQALAMVNSYTFSELDNNNKLANLILTVDDISVLMGEDPIDPDHPLSIELISVNTISGITATNEGEPHQVAPGAFIASNFNVSYELGELNINKADLTVLADNQVINEGQPAPVYTFTEDNFYGLVYEETVADVFGSNPPPYDILSTIDSAPYSTESPPGDYELTFGEVENYNILSDIHLFVNPDGPGTKAIVPKLDCVMDNGDGFTAYFMYENKNDETVWVLISEDEDNIVTGGGDPDLSQQPIEFVPGGGYWAADFDGSQMVWTVASQNHGHKTAKAQEASSDSRHCETSRSVESGFEEGSEPETILIYPNPVIDKLIIETQESEIIKGVELFNIYGTAAVVIDQGANGNLLEIDMSGMATGMYILNITMNTSLKTFKIIKR
ncbi:MAG: hypothetical protein C0591_12265, partial [Marinilabiliales bacterium]